MPMPLRVPRALVRFLAPPLFLVVAVFLLGTGMALAQAHPRGLSIVKTCPLLPVASGAAYSCSYVITNVDTLHGVNDLNVLAGPFPGVTVPIDCLQPFTPGGPNGPPVPTTGLSLGPAGSPTQSCGNDLPQTAPFNCGTSNINVADQVSASGTDAGGNLGPVSGLSTNSVDVLPLNCDDNNACTTDTCDPATGCVATPINCITPTITPTNTPTPTATVTTTAPPDVPTLSFPMMALLGLILAGAGLFLARRA